MNAAIKESVSSMSLIMMNRVLPAVADSIKLHIIVHHQAADFIMLNTASHAPQFIWIDFAVLSAAVCKGYYSCYRNAVLRTKFDFY